MSDPLTFETFVPTAGTLRAWTLARALAEGHSGGPSVLFLHGPVSVGKTHLLQASLARAGRQQPSAKGSALGAAELVQGLREAFEGGRDPAARLGWEGVGLVALDDLQRLDELTVMQRELGRLLTTVAESGTRIVCATGGRLNDLRELTGALRKAPGFAFAALKRPSARDLRRILTGTSARTGTQPRPAVWRTIASSSRGDVRRAVGALTRYGFVQSLRPAW